MIDAIRKWGVLLLACVLFVLARTWHANDVVIPEDGPVMLLGVDAYFHIRHAAYSRDHFPDHLRQDPGSHYPGVEPQQVTGLYNLGLAAAARVGSVFMDPDRALHLAAAWSPIFIGLLSLTLLFLLLKMTVSGTAANVGVLLFVFAPGAYLTKSTLGFADQHVLEVLLTLAILAALVHSSRTQRRWVRWVWGAPFALLSISWIGYPLLLGLTGIVVVFILMLSVAFTSDRQLPRAWAETLGSGSLMMGTLWWLWPTARMEVLPDAARWAVLGLLALTVLAALAGWLPRPSRKWRPLAALGLGVAVALGSWLFISFHPAGQGLWYWFSFARGTDVAEQADPVLGLLRLYFLPTLLLLAPAIFRIATRRPDQNSDLIRIVLVAMAFATLGIWWFTRDFDYLPAVFLAGGAAVGWDFVVGKVHSRFSHPLLLIVQAAFLFAGLIRTPWTSEAEVDALLLSDASWQEAMEWMAANTPNPDRSPLSDEPKTGPYPASTYGVMSGWDHGNFIAWRGNRLPVNSRYPNPNDARWLTATSEAEADSLSCPGCNASENVRYSAISWREPTLFYRSKMAAAGRALTLQQEGAWNRDGVAVPRVTFGPAWNDAMATRLTRDHGTGLSHQRLVWESAQQRLQQISQDPRTQTVLLTSDPLPPGVEGPETGNAVLTRVNNRWVYDVHVVPAVRIYEHVPGVTFIGTTAPGDTVRTSNRVLMGGRDRVYTWQQETISGPDGGFALTIPYPTMLPGKTDSLHAAAIDPWAFEVGAQRRVVPMLITENMIQRGDTLRVPHVR